MTPFPAPTNPNPSSSSAELYTTISLVKDLVAHAEATLSSVSASSSSSDAPFSRCPYDPLHRMPPESLFLHFLRCGGVPLLDLGLLEMLCYPNTLKSETDLRSESPFIRPLTESDADLCFSLEKELEEVVSGFFYKDCPGVVRFPGTDEPTRTFTLPSILSVECANFVCDRDVEIGFSRGASDAILPSEFWALRCEVKAWKDYPVKYSHTVARVASCLLRNGESDLPRWVISNSPRYGIVIDMAMRDHICLLLKLCLKAIRREAVGSLELFSCKDGTLDPRSLSLECPCLARSLMWLASQFSILYGQANGRLLAIDMLAESFLCVGSSLLFFPLDEGSCKEETYGSKLDANVGDSGYESKARRDVELANMLENVSSDRVCVSQIAAAVAALHERSLLEDRIKALRFPQPIPKFQLLNDHYYASSRAKEERGKRPNYRAILEHDGLLWQRSQNQDLGKVKTKEELLAEERDYKRRRMSYRAKKVKRTTKEVMRDIIEEHMEEIMQTGGIGCNVKGTADTETLLSGSFFQSDTRAQKLRSSDHDPSEASIRDSHVPRESLPLEYNVTARTQGDFYNKSSMDHVPHKPRYEHHETENCKRSVSKEERHTSYDSRRSSSYGSHRHSYDQHTHRRQLGDMKATNNVSDNDSVVSSYRSRDCTSRSSLTYSHTSDSKSRSRGGNIDSHRSKSMSQNVFDDRYDPSISDDRYEDVYTDVSSSSKYSLVIDASDHNGL